MLKLLYKTLLISVLSCSLLVLDFDSKGLTFNSVQAESIRTEGVKDSDMMATLTMTAVGLLASRLYMCQMTTDMMLAAAGGAAFVGGEILSTLKLKKVMKDMETQITRDKKGNINKEQIEALERLKKSYEEAKKTAGTKKMLQQAAAAAFLAAAAVAYTLYTTETTAMTTCSTAITAGGAACQSAFAASCAGAGATCYYPFQSGALASSAAGPVPAANAAQAVVPKPSSGSKAAGEAADKALQATTANITAQCPAAAGGATACNAMAVVNMTTRGWCPTPPILSSNGITKFNPQLYAHAFTPIKPESGLANLFRQMFIADAKADLFSPMGIASSAAISFLLYTSKTLGTQIDMFLYSPMNRAIIWGVLAGLTFSASSATDNVISKIESNIDKIDNILRNMNMMAQGAVGTQIAKKQPPVQTIIRPNSQMQFNETDYGEIDLTKDGNGALPCFTGPDNGKGCKSFEEANKDLPSFTSLNSESQKQINSILSNANAYNGSSKIGSASLKNTAGLASSANALRSSADVARKKAEEALKATKSKLTIDGLTNQFKNDLEKGVRDGLKKSNSSSSDMVASLYGGRGAIGSGTSSSATADVEKKSAEEKKVVPAVGVIDIGAGASSAGADVGLGGAGSASTELTAEEQARLDAAATASADAGGMDQYEIKNDISNDSTSSIFDLISNRYQKSGYPRLFKLKGPQEPAPVTK